MRKERVGFALCGSFCTHAKALEALEKVADGKATKLIIPSEIQGLAGLAASAKTILSDDKPEA